MLQAQVTHKRQSQTCVEMRNSQAIVGYICPPFPCWFLFFFVFPYLIFGRELLSRNPSITDSSLPKALKLSTESLTHSDPHFPAVTPPRLLWHRHSPAQVIITRRGSATILHWRPKSLLSPRHHLSFPSSQSLRLDLSQLLLGRRHCTQLFHCRFYMHERIEEVVAREALAEE